VPGGPHRVLLRTALLTALAMLAFAANALFCRMALGPGLIDAASFAGVRVISGTVTLGLILVLRPRRAACGTFDWRQAAMLSAYMVFFAFAYLSLSVGTGALILFGAVQITMFVSGIRAGEYFSPLSWAGLLVAAAGLIYLVWPGVTAPDLLGAVLMAVAGIAWGFYSLLGRGVADPIGATTWNFVYSVPIVLVASLPFQRELAISVQGVALAVASGAIASGCGYAIWYTALPGLTATRAAAVQLSVPVIAALAGVALIAEDVTLRLIVATAATLGGVAIVLAQRAARRPQA
jgi:drug/metabolite transporter (DMT)-like permease